MTGLRDTLISESTLCFTVSLSPPLSLSIFPSHPFRLSPLHRDRSLALPHVLSLYLSAVPLFITLSFFLSLPPACPPFLAHSTSTLRFVPSFSVDQSVSVWHGLSMPICSSYLPRLSFLLVLPFPVSVLPVAAGLPPSSEYVYSDCVSPYCIPALFVFTPYHCPCCLRSVSVHPCLPRVSHLPSNSPFPSLAPIRTVFPLAISIPPSHPPRAPLRPPFPPTPPARPTGPPRRSFISLSSSFPFFFHSTL